MRVSVCLGGILIPEYLNFHSGYSAPSLRLVDYLLVENSGS